MDMNRAPSRPSSWRKKLARIIAAEKPECVLDTHSYPEGYRPFLGYDVVLMTEGPATDWQKELATRIKGDAPATPLRCGRIVRADTTDVIRDAHERRVAAVLIEFSEGLSPEDLVGACERIASYICSTDRAPLIVGSNWIGDVTAEGESERNPIGACFDIRVPEHGDANAAVLVALTALEPTRKRMEIFDAAVGRVVDADALNLAVAVAAFYWKDRAIVPCARGKNTPPLRGGPEYGCLYQSLADYARECGCEDNNEPAERDTFAGRMLSTLLRRCAFVNEMIGTHPCSAAVDPWDTPFSRKMPICTALSAPKEWWRRTALRCFVMHDCRAMIHLCARLGLVEAEDFRECSHGMSLSAIALSWRAPPPHENVQSGAIQCFLSGISAAEYRRALKTHTCILITAEDAENAYGLSESVLAAFGVGLVEPGLYWKNTVKAVADLFL